MPSAALIVNTSSGAHLEGAPESASAKSMLEDAGINTTVLTGSLDQQIARSRESDADIIVVDGGDGTINAVIAAHTGGPRPVGIVPGGTMNLLALDYGVPSERADAVLAIAGGHTKPVDLGHVGEHIFLHTALTGLPVRIGMHREHRRGAFGVLTKGRLFFHALATVGRDQRLTLRAAEAVADDVPGAAAAPLLQSRTFCFLVGALQDELLPRPRRADVATGDLTAFAIKPHTGIDLARLLLRGVFGIDELVNDRHVSRLTITDGVLSGRRRRLHAMLDGESVLIPLPARIGVYEQAVRIFTATPSDESGTSPPK